jgi:hypothetical protein
MQRCLPPADRGNVESDITPYVSNDMVLAEAISSLSMQGFTCKDGVRREPPEPGAFECSRKKGPAWAPQLCVQKVTFTVEQGRVANLKVLPPVCEQSLLNMGAGF